ncbi:MAG: hypothetical protein JKY82_05000 [Rhizobiaceae bacterium]|nr:hypothetical protein [Rhizobiaceae bacterium]
MITSINRPAYAALTTLIILQVVMLMALFAVSAPHPPATIPLFAIAPFLGASLSVAIAAIILGPTTSVVGRFSSILAAFMALLSYGPQKYFDPQFSLIWPSVIAGQIAALAIFYVVFRAWKH